MKRARQAMRLPERAGRPAPVGGCARERRALLGGAALAALGGLVALPAWARSDTLDLDAADLPELLRALGGTPTSSEAIDLRVPALAENGAVVPVELRCALPGVQQMAIVVESNPHPFVARFTFAEGTEPYVSTRIKMAASGTVHALVRAQDRLYVATRDAQVAVGGCG